LLDTGVFEDVDDEGSHELIDAGDVVEPLKAEQRPWFRARRHICGQGIRRVWLSVAWLHARLRITGHDRFSCPIGEKTFPFVVFKKTVQGTSGVSLPSFVR